MKKHSKKISTLITFVILIQLILICIPFNSEAADLPLKKTITFKKSDDYWSIMQLPSSPIYNYEDDFYKGTLSIKYNTYDTRKESFSKVIGMVADYKIDDDKDPRIHSLITGNLEKDGYINVSDINIEWIGSLDGPGSYIGSGGDEYKYRRYLTAYFKADTYRRTAHYEGEVTRKNIVPILSINSIKNDFTNTDNMTIEGYVKDVDINQNIDINISIDDNIYKDKTIKQIKANGNNQYFKVDVPLKGIVAGTYDLRIIAIDDKGGKSQTFSTSIQIHSILANLKRDIEKYISLENDFDTRFIISNTDAEIEDSKDNDKHIEDLLNQLKDRSSQMFFIGQGGETKSYIESKLTKDYGLSSEDNTNTVINYIINENNKLSAKSNNIFLVEDYINYKMLFEDMEKDYLNISIEDKLKSNKELENEKKIPKMLQAKYKHDPNIFDNPEQAHLKSNNDWQNIKDIEDEFIIKQALKEMRGKWTLSLKGLDSTKNEKYNKYSDDKVIDFIIHERPAAVMEQWREENNNYVYVTAYNSYDIDFKYSKPNNGITEYIWKYQLENGTWNTLSSKEKRVTIPKIVNGESVINYSLTVKDNYGATDTVVATVTPPKLMNPEPDLEIITDNGDNSIYIGPYGSQQLSVIENSEPKSRITKYKYIFGFTSTSDFLDTTKNLIYDYQTCTFFKNTLKLNTNNGKVPFNRDVTLRITDDENKDIDDKKQVKFIPIKLDNISLKPLSATLVELVLDVTNANLSKHNVVATLKGQNYTISSVGGTAFKQHFMVNNGDKIDIRVYDKKDNSIIYDYKQVTAITNRPPTLDGNIDKTTIYEGDDVKLNILPNDIDGDRLNVVVEHIVNNGTSKVILNKGNVASGLVEELTLSNVDPGNHKLIITVTDPYGETSRKEITFTAKQITVTGSINPNPAMAGDEITFNLATEGYVERIEIIFPKEITDKDNIPGKFNRSGKYKYPFSFTVDKSKNKKTDTFKYITSTQLDKTLSFDNKKLRNPYKVKVKIHKKNRTREIELNLDIRRSVLDLVKPGLKQKGN